MLTSLHLKHHHKKSNQLLSVQWQIFAGISLNKELLHAVSSPMQIMAPVSDRLDSRRNDRHFDDGSTAISKAE